MNIIKNQEQASEIAKNLLYRKQLSIKGIADFTLHTKPDYQLNWHHNYLCDKLDLFIKGEIKNLMVFMPPQHGKSELVSRRLPAYMLGLNPKLKVIGASYSADLSSTFNRDVQRVIDTEAYRQIFPNIFLNSSQVRTSSRGNWLRNADIFEIVGYGGFYKSVGVGGSLTGTPADIAIIDDPIKDAMEAYSQTVRNNVWDWYVNVLVTRLHNASQKLFTMTRWHEDDPAGRILQYEGNDWEVISLPAIKENDNDPDDPRKVGEALWEDRHSLETLLKKKALSNRTFISLYQQRPAPEDGGIIKKKWFRRFNANDLPNGVIRRFRSDTAYGKEKSDNSSTICYTIHENKLYIWNIMICNLPYPAFKKAYISFLETNQYNLSSLCIFEPKATGISVVQDLEEATLTNGERINVTEDVAPKDAKETRVYAVSALIESGCVYLLEGSSWIDELLNECAVFPNGLKDDNVDNLAGILKRELLDGTEIKMFFVK